MEDNLGIEMDNVTKMLVQLKEEAKERDHEQQRKAFLLQFIGGLGFGVGLMIGFIVLIVVKLVFAATVGLV